MKKLIVLGLFGISLFACSSSKDIANSRYAAKSVTIDTSKYDITIIDPDFDRWYLLTYSDAMDHSNEFYRMKNTFAVENWNDYLTTNKYRRAISSYITYNPSIDYGIDVNRKLYWYFKYIQENYHVPLLR